MAKLKPGSPYPLGATWDGLGVNFAIFSEHDEMGRTQKGNNNAYCQDNELSWIHWDLDPLGRSLLQFTRRLIALRKQHPVLHRRDFFQGKAAAEGGVKDIRWLDIDGREMTDATWGVGFARAIGAELRGDLIGEMDENGERIADDTLLLLLNASHTGVSFSLPPPPVHLRWDVVMDTAETGGKPRIRRHAGIYRLAARSLVVLRSALPASGKRDKG